MRKGLYALIKPYIYDYVKDGKLTIPKHTLAKIIYDQYPHLRTGKTKAEDIDAIRGVIRSLCGAKGKSKVKPIIMDKGTTEQGLHLLQNFINESDSEQLEPYKIQGAKDIVILNDLHIPFHDKIATTIALQWIFDKQPDVLYLNGDIMDCYNQSRFNPDPRRRNTKGEIELTRQFLSMLRYRLPNTRIIYKFGNHEKRWEDYLKSAAAQFLELDDFKLQFILRFNEFNIEHIPQHQHAIAGYLHILHGHELGKQFGIPANPSRWLYTKVKSNAAIGHLHVTSSHYESSLNKSQNACFTIGCLCGLSPEYFPVGYTKWNHGFAHVEMDGDNFVFNNYNIIDGKLFR